MLPVLAQSLTDPDRQFHFRLVDNNIHDTYSIFERIDHPFGWFQGVWTVVEAVVVLCSILHISGVLKTRLSHSKHGEYVGTR